MLTRYDPLRAPDPQQWLALDEQERIEFAERFHRKARIKLPNQRVHAAFHAVVETQIAMGDELLPVASTVARLMAEGLDRHEAVHAVGSVLAQHMYALQKGEQSDAEDPNAGYFEALHELSAQSWREG